MSIIQHTPDEGPGSILAWAHSRGYEATIYHPYAFNGVLPQAEATDLLVILGGPMSPNDDVPWIKAERVLIAELIKRDTPMFGACYGAQQIAKTLGYAVSKSPAKEVGWDPIDLQSQVIAGLPDQLLALHWHEEMFEVPAEAELLFSGEHLENQGFVMNHRIVGLQCHLEPESTNVREMVANDGGYIAGSVLGQTAADILAQPVPSANRNAMFRLLDYICEV